MLAVYLRRLLGSRRTRSGNRQLGLILAGVLGLVVTIVVLNLGHVLRALGQQPQVIDLAGPYYTGFAFAMLPIVWFGVLRSFAAAMMKTGFVLAVTVFAIGAPGFLSTDNLVNVRYSFSTTLTVRRYKHRSQTIPDKIPVGFSR